MVVSAIPFQVSSVALEKPVPVAVSVNAGPPAITVAGVTLVKVREPVMIKGKDEGCGLPVTLTAAVPGLVRRFAGTVAVSRLPVTNCVVRVTPFQVTDVP